MREALRPHLQEGDWEQQVLFGKDLSPIRKIAEIGHGHISVEQIRDVLSQSDWADYFKFGIVRNPFDRFVSVCAFLNRDNPEYSSNPRGWMKAAIERPRFRHRVLVRPQVEQLSGTDGELAIDYVGRYETLQASLNEVLARLDLPCFELRQRNASSHEHYREYYDQELQQAVARFYESDIDAFKYVF